MAKRKKKGKAAASPTQLVIQQGGTSFEWYPSLYDKLSYAEDAIRGHRQASYNAIGPIEVSAKLMRALALVPGAEAELIELIDTVSTKVSLHEFSDLEAVDAEVKTAVSCP